MHGTLAPLCSPPHTQRTQRPTTSVRYLHVVHAGWCRSPGHNSTHCGHHLRPSPLRPSSLCNSLSQPPSNHICHLIFTNDCRCLPFHSSHVAPPVRLQSLQCTSLLHFHFRCSANVEVKTTAACSGMYNLLPVQECVPLPLFALTAGTCSGHPSTDP